MIFKPPGSNISINFLDRFSGRIVLVQLKVDKNREWYNFVYLLCQQTFTKPLTVCHDSYFMGEASGA